MHLPLNICKEDGLLYSVFRCFYCSFVNRAMVCKAISRDWRCCLTCCWVASCMHSFPTVCSLFQFLNTLNAIKYLRCSLVICSEGALEPWTKLSFNTRFLRPNLFAIYSPSCKKKEALMLWNVLISMFERHMRDVDLHWDISYRAWLLT